MNRIVPTLSILYFRGPADPIPRDVPLLAQPSSSNCNMTSRTERFERKPRERKDEVPEEPEEVIRFPPEKEAVSRSKARFLYIS